MLFQENTGFTNFCNMSSTNYPWLVPTDYCNTVNILNNWHYFHLNISYHSTIKKKAKYYAVQRSRMRSCQADEFCLSMGDTSPDFHFFWKQIHYNPNDLTWVIVREQEQHPFFSRMHNELWKCSQNPWATLLSEPKATMRKQVRFVVCLL